MTPSSSSPDIRTSDGAHLSNLVGLKLGNYRLEKLVGRGRMGVVYLAKDEALLRPTAVKILSWRVAEAHGQDPVQWFLAEARMVARINHPRVVQIYGAARQGDHCYLAMEYVDGASAEAAVQRGPMAPEIATDVLLQAAAALQAAHHSGVVHRDVKPANLLIGQDGVTKLGDFGMALGSAELRTGNAHLRVGTPYYTAPEIWRGEVASAASDIYSLGATYFHLLTGRPPYPGHDVVAVEQAHLRAPIPDPRELVPGLPASCAALIRHALAKVPRERHGSARELVWEAKRVLQDLTSTSTRPTGPGRNDRPPAPIRRQEPTSSSAPAPTGPLAKVLGFTRRPFSQGEPSDCPYHGEPFASAKASLLARVDDDSTTVFALTGAEGSGRTVLCHRIAIESTSRLVLVVDGSKTAGDASLLQRLCRAAGVEDSSETGGLDSLANRMAEERQSGRPKPLVVLDGLMLPLLATSGLSKLIELALWTRSFKLLLVGPLDLLVALLRSGCDFHGESVPEVPIPALDRSQISAYVSAWMDAARAPGSPPVILSPDALLLLALRSEGALPRINFIAENMLLLAAAERRRVLSSWHAWVAPDQERWSDVPGDLFRPVGWPPREVIDVIDACRRGAGIPPWPREEAR